MGNTYRGDIPINGRFRPIHPASWVLVLILLALTGDANGGEKVRVWVQTRSSGSAAGNTNAVSPPVGTSVPAQNTPLISSEAYGRWVDVDTTAAVGAAFSVFNTADTGVGSLRKAIQNANSSSGLSTISFAIGSGPATITPLSPLPEITVPIIIDGTTQGAYAGAPLIELRGTFLNDGLVLLGGNSTVRGLVINGCRQSGIHIAGFGNNAIEGNYIGTTASGDSAVPNGWSGVTVLNSSGNMIGGLTPEARNVIAGNRNSGIRIEGALSTGTVIRGNYIGLNKDGSAAIRVDSSNGIEINSGASQTVIGGGMPEARNIISGHDYPGIVVADQGSDGTVILGNYIGTQQNGFYPVPNGDGIRVTNGPVGTLIGDGTSAGRNIIAGNRYPNIFLESRIAGPFARGTVIRGNAIGEGVNGIAMRNSVGIEIYQSPDNVIGDTVAGGENRIVNGYEFGFTTGAYGYGITVAGDSSTNNTIRGNRITGNEGGVWIENAPGTTIGGPQPLGGNVIDQNRSHGVVVYGYAPGTTIQGNRIGTDPLPVSFSARGNRGNGILCMASGTTIGGPTTDYGNVIGYNGMAGILDSLGTGNRISHNSIFKNVAYGIGLGSPSLNVNDSLDADTGPNERQNFPVLDSISYSVTSARIRAHLDSKPGKPYILEFFGGTERHGSRFGEGETLIGTATVYTDSRGRADITETLPVIIPVSWFITATATDQDGNTSQFSRALSMADADGDGLLDIWETDGIDVNADGLIDLDLPAKRADPLHKDLFVEVDWMENLWPLPGVLEKVVTAFRGVPRALVDNPDGHPGIELHIDAVDTDPAIPAAAWSPNPWPEFYAAKVANFGSVDDRADPNARFILEAKNLVYRYCIFAQSFDAAGTSGLASDIPGSDFFVSLGLFPTAGGSPEEQAGTFMHELGHTLGLGHGGALGDGDTWKPNYYSVMNYMWQFPRGFQPGGWKLDYSRSTLPSLDENHLVESAGLNPGHLPYPALKIPYNRPDNSIALTRLTTQNVAVNWDGVGDSAGTASGPVTIHWVDHALGRPAAKILDGHTDWPGLAYNFRDQPLFSIRPLPPFLPSSISEILADEMTVAMRNDMMALPDYGIEEPLSDWPGDAGSATPISTAPLTSLGQVAAGDGHGGAIVAWSFSPPPPPYGTGAVYVQRIDSLGGVRWQNKGIRLPAPRRGGAGPAIASDGKGGAFIAWIDRDMLAVPRAPANIYIQRVDEAGRRIWAEGGVQVSAVVTDTSMSIPLVIGDGAEGAIVVWRDRHLGQISTYAQRLNPTGVPLWNAGGVRITNTEVQGWLESVVSDDSSGAIIVWPDNRSPSNVDLYAQRVDASGALRWNPTGTPVSAAPSTQLYHSAIPDGSGGAIVTWQDYRATRWEIYAQRMNRAGQAQWTADGAPVQTGAGERRSPVIVSDSAGGAIIAWNAIQGPLTPIYAQRMSASGVPLWPPAGAVVSEVWRTNLPLAIISDQRHGAIIGYSASVSNDINHTNGVWAQRIDSTGTRMWQAGGTKIAPNGNYDISPAPDNGGGAIMAFQSLLNPSDIYGGSGVYVQKVNDGGGLGGGILTDVRSSSEEQPGAFELMQNYPNPFNPSTTIAFKMARDANVTIILYDILGRKVRTVVDARYAAGTFTAVWDGRNEGGMPVATGVYFMTMRVEEVGQAGPVFMNVRKMMLLR